MNMTERRADHSPRGAWRPGRINPAAAALSLLFHAVLLLALQTAPNQVRPVARNSDAPSARVSYIDLAPLAAAAVDPIRSPDVNTRPVSARDRAGARGEMPVLPPVTGTHPGMSDGPLPQDGPHHTPSSALETAASRLRSGFRDARLLVNVPGLRPPLAPTPLGAQLNARLNDAMHADEDSLTSERQRALSARQATVFGRRITVFGDSAQTYARRFMIANKRVTLPVDGREWQDMQMKKQRDDFVRDSILRARVRSTRERTSGVPQAGEER